MPDLVDPFAGKDICPAIVAAGDGVKLGGAGINRQSMSWLCDRFRGRTSDNVRNPPRRQQNVPLVMFSS